MTWVIKVGDQEIVSDDFTLGDLDQIEKETDTYWSVANPFRSSRVAKAFLRVAYRRAGRDPDEVDDMTLGQLKSVFDFRADEGDDEEPERPTKSRRKPTSRGSSATSPPATTGPHLSAASSA